METLELMESDGLPQGVPKYSIVVPAFEEAELIAGSLQELHDYLESENILHQTEIIVVAAKGNDSTAELARAKSGLFAHFQLVEPGPKAGKGRDVKAGVAASRGKFVAFTDADLATPAKHFKELFSLLENSSCDVAIGVRNLWVIHKGFKRKAMSVAANWLVRLFLLPGVPDSQCGFKGFTREAAEVLFSRMTIQGWAFDMELLTIARIHKLRIIKIPISDWTDPKLEKGLAGESNWKASLSTLKELFRIRKQRIKGVYT